MRGKTANELPPMDPNTLEDDDLLIIWDKSAYDLREHVIRSKDDAPLPFTTKHIRLGDLKAYLQKKPTPVSSGFTAETLKEMFESAKRVKDDALAAAKQALEEAYVKYHPSSRSKEFNKWAASFFSWEDPTPEKDIEACELAWNACKNRVLKILETPIQNLDLSTEEVDRRFIDKIKEL